MTCCNIEPCPSRLEIGTNYIGENWLPWQPIWATLLVPGLQGSSHYLHVALVPPMLQCASLVAWATSAWPCFFVQQGIESIKLQTTEHLLIEMEYQKQKSHDIEQNHRTSLSKLLPNHQSFGHLCWSNAAIIFEQTLGNFPFGSIWKIPPHCHANEENNDFFNHVQRS